MSWDILDNRPSEKSVADDFIGIPASASFSMISGHDNVLAQQQILSDLAARCQQVGAMEQLPYYLSACRTRAKFPHLLLLSHPSKDLIAAVLLYEYRIAAIPTGIYMSSDFGGQRTVIAPESLRSSVAKQAAIFLLNRRTLLVLTSVADGDFSPAATGGFPALSSRHLLATQIRTIRRTMELKDTYDATLATLGHDTRRNFRRHTRKVDDAFHTSFVVEPEITETEFLALNRASAFPVSETTALWRFGAARKFKDSIFSGLRDSDGRWLCMLGGRRQADLTDVDWQLNLAGLQGYSLVTAMRAHLIQHEIDCGTRLLRFDGGTAHSMNLSFLQEDVTDLLLARRFLGKHLLTRTLPRVLPPDSLLGNVLRSKDLVWQD